MKVAISQPRYLPALNYFQRILISDVFVILDNVQHQRRAYEHRNKIKSTNGNGVWCSIPLSKDSSRPNIVDLKISKPSWVIEHKEIIKSYYQKAKYFDEEILNSIYNGIVGNDFVQNVMAVTMSLCSLLNIDYNFIYASELDTHTYNDKLLHEITKLVGGNEYISGPNGRNYIDKKSFLNIKLTYHEFEFPVYEQINGSFVPWISIIDQLFNIGIEETRKIIFATPLLKDN